MHQLGYELPERQGFGGLWEAMAESAVTETGALRRTAGDVECEPTLVAVSRGAGSSTTRAAVAAFRQLCCGPQERAAA